MLFRLNKSKTFLNLLFFKSPNKKQQQMTDQVRVFCRVKPSPNLTYADQQLKVRPNHAQDGQVYKRIPNQPRRNPPPERKNPPPPKVVRSVDLNTTKPKKVPPKKALSWDQDDFQFVDEDEDNPFRPKPLPKNKKVEEKVDKHGLKIPQYRNQKAPENARVPKEDATRKFVSIFLKIGFL